MEGSLNKIISYEGGISIICIWGLCPMSHLDDSSRAVLAAMNIKQAISEFCQFELD